MSAHGAVLLGIGIAVAGAFGASCVHLMRHGNVSAVVQLVGAAGLVVVVMSHVAETFRWLRGWAGAERTAPAIISILPGPSWASRLLPAGYLADVLMRRADSPSASRES